MSSETYSGLSQLEREFATAVVEGVGQLATRHGGPLVVLFDIDGTLVFGSPGSPDEYFRSGFEPVVQTLKKQYGDRIDFGVLTTVSQEECDPESRKYTKILDPLIAVTNSQFMGYAYPMDMIRILPFNVERQEFDRDYRSLHEEQFGKFTQEALFTKLILLDRMLEQHADTGFVVVEDLPWVRRLQGVQPRTQGVCIGPPANDLLD